MAETNFIRDLVVDVGVSEGDDTAFYLQKGFRVVGIEADPRVFAQLHERFATEIRESRLIILNRAASTRSGHTLEFFSNKDVQGHSSLAGLSAPEGRAGEIHAIPTIGWEEILTVLGNPYYCKVDIEGAEVPFLAGFQGKALPKYLSVECHDFAPIESLYAIGYREFRLLHQSAHNAFPAHNPPKEGKYLPYYQFGHSSGYFGEELYHQVWASFRDIAGVYDALLRVRSHGAIPHLWFDCHARLSG